MAAVLEDDPADRRRSDDLRRLGLFEHGDAGLGEVALHQLRTPRVELLAQQSLAPFQHRHLQPEEVQRVGRLQAEQSAAGHHRLTAAVLLDVCA